MAAALHQQAVQDAEDFCEMLEVEPGLLEPVTYGHGKPLTEAVLQKATTKALKKLANRAWYLRVAPGPFQVPGVPDFILCSNGKFIALELKASRGGLSELQKIEAKKIIAAGGGYFLLRLDPTVRKGHRGELRVSLNQLDEQLVPHFVVDGPLTQALTLLLEP